MTTLDMRTQPVMGIVPPEVGEARVAERWPSVARFAGLARLGSSIQQAARDLFRWAIGFPALLSAVLVAVVVPICAVMGFAAWIMLAPLYFLKVLPVFMTKYQLTNRRLMILKGWSLKPTQEVHLSEIQSVQVAPGSEQPFFLAATIEVRSPHGVALTLPGVPEYQSFIKSVEYAQLAWGRKEPPKEQAHSAAELTKMKVEK